VSPLRGGFPVSHRRLLLLAAAVTDATFGRTTLDGQVVWVGKCLHCGKKLVVRDDGRAISEATLEHVWPEAQGGTHDLSNLAVACAGCNREKGSRHDHRGGQRLDEVVAVLRARRLERWRDPAEVGMAGRLVAVMPKS
jgi:5-methylcytosine-specific restriction endonuclease McrA